MARSMPVEFFLDSYLGFSNPVCKIVRLQYSQWLMTGWNLSYATKCMYFIEMWRIRLFEEHLIEPDANAHIFID